MKLRNKKTGDVAIVEIIDDRLIIYYLDGRKLVERFESVADLEEWEDYEEPKDFWFIDDEGDVEGEGEEYEENVDKMKSIGNYFKTKEETEKAVEKLKAWKRLKDKGFKFCCDIEYEALCGNGFTIPLKAIMPPEVYTDVEVNKDLHLLFGDEE